MKNLTKDIILYDVKIKSILFRVKRANIDICLRNVISKHDTSDVANKTGDLFFILAKLSFVSKFYKFLNSHLFFFFDNHKLIVKTNYPLDFRFNLFKLYYLY